MRNFYKKYARLCQNNRNNVQNSILNVAVPSMYPNYTEFMQSRNQLRQLFLIKAEKCSLSTHKIRSLLDFLHNKLEKIWFLDDFLE